MTTIVVRFGISLIFQEIIMKCYDIKSGVMGYIPWLDIWMQFETEGAYNEYFNEGSND